MSDAINGMMSYEIFFDNQTFFINEISIQTFKQYIVIISIQNSVFSSELPATLIGFTNCTQYTRRV